MTVPSGKVCETYKEVCFELGLLSEDSEWTKVFEEAATTKMPAKIRDLAIIVFLFCMPSSPRQLFDEFWTTWSEDFQLKAERQGITLTESQKKTMVLLDLETKLQSFEKSLKDFGLPVPSQEDLASVSFITSILPAVIREELQFDVEQEAYAVEERFPTFTEEQRSIFETVMENVRSNRPIQIFIDARGGCGKTYLLNTILSGVRSMEPGGCIALAMATTGIAANLLTLGRTFHSRMKAPLAPTEESTLQISGQSQLAELIRRAKLLIVDESTMLDRFQLEALERSLRDIMQTPNIPFGGKVLILSGDFRQCLPIVQGATRAGIVQQCINQSHLWSCFKQMKLSTNMRVLTSGEESLANFDRWTLSIGNGDQALVEVPEYLIDTIIVPNSKDNPNSEGAAMKEFCGKIFPNLETNFAVPGFLDGRTILATTNIEVDMLNETVCSMIPGDGIEFKSSDEQQSRPAEIQFRVLELIEPKWISSSPAQT